MKWLTKSFAGILLIAAILFIPAGTLNWIMGWAYVGTFVLVTVVSAVLVDPDLLAERDLRKHKNVKRWDVILLSIHGLLSVVAIPIIAGLGVRFQWLPKIPVWLQIAALFVNALGWSLHIWAMVANKFHAKVVRIQSDRGQTVVTDGPYRYVRHPGYVGGIILNLASPIMLGSVWALIPGVLGALLLIIRTVLEDRMLLEELEGYKEYAQRVYYRLLPGIW
jgi:protein-S-isoprenylcysteine O-methyltransferase Ste14